MSRHSLLGTQSGVPTFRMPLSTWTPTMMGSRVLKMNSGRILSLQGKMANWKKKNGRMSLVQLGIQSID